MATKSEEKQRLDRELEILLQLPETVLPAEAVAKLLGNVSDQVQVVRDNVVRATELDLLRDVVKKITEAQGLDIQPLAEEILTGANKLVPFSDGAIGLVEDQHIHFRYAIGENALEVMQFLIPIGEGLTGEAVKKGKPIRVNDTSVDSRYRGQIETTLSELDVPIMYEGKAIGVINAESKMPNTFTADHERLLVALAEHAALAINTSRLLEDFNALADIAKQLTSMLDYDDIIQAILRTTSRLIHVPEVSIGQIQDTGILKFTHAVGPSHEDVIGYEPEAGKGLTVSAIKEKRPIRVGNVLQDTTYARNIGATRSELDVPILHNGEVIGVLNAESPELNAFSERDENIMTALASYAAIAISNAEAYQVIQRKFEKAQQRYIAAETMAAIGDLAGNLVHRMNNDIGAIRVRAKQIVGSTDDEAIKDKATRIGNLAESVLGQVKEFRERFKEVEPGHFDINTIIRMAIQEVPVSSNVQIHTNLVENKSTVFGAEEHLKEVFRNLIANGIEAMPAGGNLSVSSRQIAGYIEIRVQDNGHGIPKDIQSKIFDRSYTTKPEGRGLGYGLWWVRGYLSRIEGTIILEESVEGKGSTFLVSFPISQP